MKLYAETPFHRSRQIAADAAVALWILLWIRICTWIHELVDRLAGAGTSVEGATLALWLGILLAVIPIGYVLLRYAPWRGRWIREASAASRLRIDSEDLHLFALRAVATRPLYELQRVTPDPAAALARGDYESLASLELGALGLKGTGGH